MVEVYFTAVDSHPRDFLAYPRGPQRSPGRERDLDEIFDHLPQIHGVPGDVLETADGAGEDARRTVGGRQFSRVARPRVLAQHGDDHAQELRVALFEGVAGEVERAFRELPRLRRLQELGEAPHRPDLEDEEELLLRRLLAPDAAIDLFELDIRVVLDGLGEDLLLRL